MDVPSALADLRDVPLGEIPAPIVDGALVRVLPAVPVAAVPVAAFNSAI